jgi:hypothetical protein
MKPHAFILIAVFACGSQLDAQIPPDTLTGHDVLERSRAAYAGLSSYTGETAVLSEIAIGDTVMTEAATAEIRFERLGRFRISGRLPMALHMWW